jgi:hypothetical protein
VDEASIIASKDPRFKGTDADVKTIFSHIFLKTPVADAKLVENVAVEAKADGEEAFKVGLVAQKRGKAVVVRC